MIELIHTSAPTGLLDQRPGYTVVACTEGTPPDLVRTLANGSASRMQRLPAGARAEPHATYRIWPITSSAGPFIVLSRIVPLTADYSGRPSRLAHHVALNGGEATGKNLAAILLSPDSFHDSWPEPPRELPPLTVPDIDVVAQLAGSDAELERLTSYHEGWAEFLATEATKPQSQARLLLVPPDAALRKILASIVARIDGAGTIRIETSEDHLVDARPSLVITGQEGNGLTGLVQVADWSRTRGTEPPPAFRPAAPPRRTRASPGAEAIEPLDLSSVSVPEPVPGDPIASFEGFGVEEPCTAPSAHEPASPASQAAVALGVYATGAVIGAAVTLAIAHAMGAFQGTR